MPQFVVPQFIDVEDKIIGPITTRQFIMGIVAALAVFVSYRLADTFLFAVEAFIIVGVYIVLGFIKVNGRPTYYFLLNMFQLVVRPQLRVWRKETITPPKQKKEPTHVEPEAVPARKRLEPHSLSSLALLVDTGGAYRPEELLAQERKK